jgi:hypothetical protein
VVEICFDALPVRINCNRNYVPTQDQLNSVTLNVPLVLSLPSAEICEPNALRAGGERHVRFPSKRTLRRYAATRSMSVGSSLGARELFTRRDTVQVRK